MLNDKKCCMKELRITLLENEDISLINKTNREVFGRRTPDGRNDLAWLDYMILNTRLSGLTKINLFGKTAALELLTCLGRFFSEHDINGADPKENELDEAITMANCVKIIDNMRKRAYYETYMNLSRDDQLRIDDQVNLLRARAHRKNCELGYDDALELLMHLGIFFSKEDITKL